MTNRKRMWWILGAVAAGSLLLTVYVLAQTAGTQASTATGATDFWAKVASNLGVSREALLAARDKAELQMIEEELASGKITAEQAAAMTARIEARQALEAVLNQALAEGKITQEQLQAWGCRGMGRRMQGVSSGSRMGSCGCRGR